jgi:hypothetical protein
MTMVATRTAAPRKTKIVGASLDPVDLRRLDRYIKHQARTAGLRLKRGAALARLARLALDTAEAEREAGA